MLLHRSPGCAGLAPHLLLLREDEERLLEPELRLLLLALGLLLRLEVEPLRLLLLLPLEAEPRLLLLLLLRGDDEPDFDEEEEEELRDAIACSFGGLMHGRRFCVASAFRSI
jgi:hypothetical protein